MVRWSKSTESPLFFHRQSITKMPGFFPLEEAEILGNPVTWIIAITFPLPASCLGSKRTHLCIARQGLTSWMDKLWYFHICGKHCASVADIGTIPLQFACDNMLLLVAKLFDIVPIIVKFSSEIILERNSPWLAPMVTDC